MIKSKLAILLLYLDVDCVIAPFTCWLIADLALRRKSLEAPDLDAYILKEHAKYKRYVKYKMERPKYRIDYIEKSI